jgi:hypothetical protein
VNHVFEVLIVHDEMDGDYSALQYLTSNLPTADLLRGYSGLVRKCLICPGNASLLASRYEHLLRGYFRPEAVKKLALSANSLN